VTPKERKNFGAEVRRARRDRRWDVHRLASEAGVVWATANSVEYGRRAHAGTIAKVARALGIDSPVAHIPTDERRRGIRPRGEGLDEAGVDAAAARYDVRALADVPRLPREARVIVERMARSVGMPSDWLERRLGEFEA
jgi:transcriptional regulator with XRE-family HTH domain